MQILAASDKFRGTATAQQVCQAVAQAAYPHGYTVRLQPLSDGGEGFLQALGGVPHYAEVTGPLGNPVKAQWNLLPDQQMAVIEMAQAAGLELAGGSAHNQPEAATTRGVGELMVAAYRAGARKILVGCGGSATTDGGLGALEAVWQAGGLPGASLWVATDVETLFVDAARVFSPQKGADAATVQRLGQRLTDLAQRYQQQYGVEVTRVPGSGAAGGLAGGLLVLGAQIQSGFTSIAQAVGLEQALQEADLVVTGEGKLDLTSLEGKVVGGVLRLARPGQRVLVVVGQALPQVAQLAQHLGQGQVTVVSLSERFGAEAAMEQTLPLIEQVVGEYLAVWGRSVWVGQHTWVDG